MRLDDERDPPPKRSEVKMMLVSRRDAASPIDDSDELDELDELDVFEDDDDLEELDEPDEPEDLDELEEPDEPEELDEIEEIAPVAAEDEQPPAGPAWDAGPARDADPARDRLDLADGAGCLALAEEAATGTRSGVEAMLAHQLAAAHAVAMKLAGRAAMHSARADRGHQQRFRPDWEAHEIGLARAANSAARMMTAFQRGALALDRLRHGSRHTITVQRVDAADRG